MCTKCRKSWDVELNGIKYCREHGIDYLNSRITIWQEEYDNPETSHSRKRYLWFSWILPATRIRDNLRGY